MRFLSIYLRELVCTHIRPCRDYETPAPGAAGCTPSRLKNGSGKYMSKFSILYCTIIVQLYAYRYSGTGTIRGCDALSFYLVERISVYAHTAVS